MLLYCLAAINLFNAADLFLYSPSRLKASKNIFPLTIFARNFKFFCANCANIWMFIQFQCIQSRALNPDEVKIADIEEYIPR